MSGRQRVYLRDICRPRQWPTIPETELTDSGFPVYGANGRIGHYHSFNHEKPTILVTCRGATCGTINICEPKSYVTGNAMALDELDTARVNMKWFSYNLIARGFADVISGSAQPQITQSNIGLLEIQLPPLGEQERMARILDEADQMKRLVTEADRCIAKFSPALFNDMFGDPFINPKKWAMFPLKELATKFSDGPFGSNLKSEHYTETGIRVVRLQNIGIGEFVDEDKAFVPESHYNSIKKHECLPGDVIVGTLGVPNLRACILPDSIPQSINKADCVQVRPRRDVATAEYLCWLLNMPSTLYMASGLIMGQTRSRISMGRLSVLHVPAPPLDLQQTFTARIAEFQLLKAEQDGRARHLNGLFQSLLSNAFQGEL